MNAIILAAGMGTRLLPYTQTKPKSLVEINGEPIVERQIRFLKEAGIHDITIVVGYYADQFEYLRHKYSVSITFNPAYKKYNNLYSLYLVKEKLADSYIVEADVYLCENIFEKNKPNGTSKEYIIQRNTDRIEWIVRFKESNQISVIEMGVPTNQDYIMSGVSYWCKADTIKLKTHLENTIQDEQLFKDMYWNDIAKARLEEFALHIQCLEAEDCYEIDTVEELKLLENILNTKEEYRVAK